MSSPTPHGPRRIPSPLALAPIVLLLASACPAPTAPDPRESGPANLLLVTVDTLRADRLGAYGHEAARTPHVDALAREGTLFTAAYTPVPRTTQAVASLFTSVHPHRHGVLEIGERLPGAAVTLAERLRERGYATAGISANGAASRLQGLDQGFDHFLDVHDLRHRHPIPAPGRARGRPGMEPARAVTQEAVAWLDRREDEPWFLWLLYMEPHFRYEPPPRWNGGRTSHDHPFYRAMSGLRPRRATIFFDLGGVSSAARGDLSRLYDGEVAFADAWIGRLLEAVRVRDDGGRTLVVLTADHGESLGEHGYFYEHGAYLYAPTVRVPLVWHWPGVVPAGRRVTAPASLLDVWPTAAGLMGLDPGGASFDGRDLSPTWRSGGAPSKRILFAQSGSSLHPQAPRRIAGGRRSARSGNRDAFRYVRDGRWVALRRGGDGPVALYDVEADPALRRDRSDAEPEVLARLHSRLADADPLATRWRMAADERFRLVRIPTWDGPRHELYDVRRDARDERDVLAEHPEAAARLAAALDAWTRRALAEARPAAALPEADQAEMERRLRALGYLE